MTQCTPQVTQSWRNDSLASLPLGWLCWCLLFYSRCLVGYRAVGAFSHIRLHLNGDSFLRVLQLHVNRKSCLLLSQLLDEFWMPPVVWQGNFVMSGFPKKHMGDRAIRDVKQYCPCSELSGEKEHNQKTSRGEWIFKVSFPSLPLKNWGPNL